MRTSRAARRSPGIRGCLRGSDPAPEGARVRFIIERIEVL
jgi:hypothetical protein